MPGEVKIYNRYFNSTTPVHCTKPQATRKPAGWAAVEAAGERDVKREMRFPADFIRRGKECDPDHVRGWELGCGTSSCNNVDTEGHACYTEVRASQDGRGERRNGAELHAWGGAHCPRALTRQGRGSSRRKGARDTIDGQTGRGGWESEDTLCIYPAGKRGAGARITFCDHWENPVIRRA